jgi:hypothetical protein
LTYSPDFESGVSGEHNAEGIWNPELGHEPTNCNADCSVAPTNTCNKECHGWNGCDFSKEPGETPIEKIADVMDACDGKQPGFKVFFSNGVNPDTPADDEYVTCCHGPIEEKVSKQVNLEEGLQNLVVVKKPAMYNGQPVNVVFLVYNRYSK